MTFTKSRRSGSPVHVLQVVLAPREIAVIRLAADALSNHEIAEELGLAETTVQWYLHSIYRGLAISRGRVELANWWQQYGATCERGLGVDVEHPAYCRGVCCSDVAA
jgi:DNA-binding NarL/FixJ family response regulator